MRMKLTNLGKELPLKKVAELPKAEISSLEKLVTTEKPLKNQQHK